MEIVYGVNPIAELLKARKRRILKLYAQDQRRVSALEARSGAAGLIAVMENRGRLEMLCGTSHNQGLVAEVEDYPYADLDVLFEQPQKFVLALDNLTDPQNVGAILRTAYCAGVSGVTLRSHHAAKVTSAVAKASAGAVEHLLISLVPNQSLVIDKAKEEGFLVAALDMEGTSIFKEKLPFKRPVLLIIGAEDQGVGTLLKKRADVLVKIPMKGDLDSLNASAAAAIALFEIARRRN